LRVGTRSAAIPAGPHKPERVLRKDRGACSHRCRVKAMADPKLSEACKAMISDSVQGARIIALSTLGLRNMYSKREIRKIEDIKGLKIRVQATPTEDTMFPAYGAQTVHMPFGSVYTSLQTGVVDVAENGVNVYLANKHYEVAPVLSMTEHEANNSF